MESMILAIRVVPRHRQQGPPRSERGRSLQVDGVAVCFFGMSSNLSQTRPGTVRLGLCRECKPVLVQPTQDPPHKSNLPAQGCQLAGKNTHSSIFLQAPPTCQQQSAPAQPLVVKVVGTVPFDALTSAPLAPKPVAVQNKFAAQVTLASGGISACTTSREKDPLSLWPL